MTDGSNPQKRRAPRDAWSIPLVVVGMALGALTAHAVVRPPLHADTSQAAASHPDSAQPSAIDRDTSGGRVPEKQSARGGGTTAAKGGETKSPSAPGKDVRQAGETSSVAANKTADRTSHDPPSPEKQLPATPTLKAAGAHDALLELVGTVGKADALKLRAIRDTAEMYYKLGGVDDTNRALAAYLAGSASNKLGDLAGCADWVHKALTLAPDHKASRTLLTQCAP